METVQTRQLDDLAALAAGLDLPGLGEEADWLGRLDKIIKDLGVMRRDVIDELDGPQSGSDYRITEGRTAKRSYNTAAILSAFAEKDWTLHNLLAADAVRLSWRWTELKKAYHQAGLDLMVASREIADDGDVEAPPVGEVWSSSFRIEGVE